MIDLLDSLDRHSSDPAVLAAIRADDCNLAVWHRPAFADFTPMVSGDPLDLRFGSDVAGLEARLVGALREARFEGEPELHRALAQDAAQLAKHFCAAMNLARFELRLELVRTDSCRKFHADYVTARLITTYVGEGTDWLNQADAARVAEGGQPQRINRLAPFDVGLFKGKLSTGRPAIHRSPPIAETSAGARLLLVLNPPSGPFDQSPESPLPPLVHLA